MRPVAHLNEDKVELVQVALFTTHPCLIRGEVDVGLDDEVSDTCKESARLS